MLMKKKKKKNLRNVRVSGMGELKIGEGDRGRSKIATVVAPGDEDQDDALDDYNDDLDDDHDDDHQVKTIIMII